MKIRKKYIENLMLILDIKLLMLYVGGGSIQVFSREDTE